MSSHREQRDRQRRPTGRRSSFRYHQRMAEASEQVSFAKYAVKPVCSGCDRKLSRTEPLWFVGIPQRAVFGVCCFDKAAAL